MKVFFLFVGMYLCHPILAQEQHYVDSVRYYTMMGKNAKVFLLAKADYNAIKESNNDDPAYIVATTQLAGFYYGMVKPDSALFYYEKACEGAKKRFGAASQQYGALLVRAAIMCSDVGQYPEADRRFERAAGILRGIEGKGKTEYIRCLAEHANFCITMGSLNKAEELCVKASEIALRKPADMEGYALVLDKMARLYGKMGFHAKQDTMLMQVFEINKHRYDAKHYKYIHAIVGIGEIYQRNNKLEKADSVYRKALEITEQETGKSSPANVYLLRRIGIVNTEMGKYEVAENYLKKALDIVSENGGEVSPLYPMCGNNLARLYAASGRKEMAAYYFKKTLAVYNKLGLTLHTARLSLLYDMADLLENDESANAAGYLKQAMDTEKKLLLEKLDFLSEPELLTYLKGIKDAAERPYRFLMQHKSPAIVEAAYNNRLLISGIGLQNTRTLYKNMSSSEDSELSGLWKNYQQQKSFYTNLLLTPVAQRTLDADSIAAMLNRQEKDILRKSADYRNMKQQLAITWQDVQKRLQPGETAVEFVRFNGSNFTNIKADTFYYAALLLRPQDTMPQFIMLCNEKELMAAMKKFPYKAFVTSRGKKDVEYNPSTTNSFFKLIWQPLETYLAETKTVYFSPSAMLHRVAFAAIPYKNNELLCDKYNLVQLTSTREIALQETLPKAPVSLAMFGGINYSHQSFDTTYGLNSNDYAVNRSADIDSFPFLPHTLSEVNTIKKEAAAVKKLPIVFTDDNATEAAFRSMGGKNSPEVVHFATHGFVLPDTVQGSKTGTAFKSSDNPLLRCGLVMAGGNNGWKGNVALNEDDGILTGLEISMVQLPNTQLAVLSACETGLGKIEGSEGVFGLQRAFKLAGVNYIMASLWQVPDKETAEFMEIFYSHWLGGKTIREAFFTTQQSMRKKYTPYFWAGFTLVQ